MSSLRDLSLRGAQPNDPDVRHNFDSVQPMTREELDQRLHKLETGIEMLRAKMRARESTEMGFR